MSKITEQDLVGINTYGFKYELDEYGYLFIQLPHAIVMAHKRNSYCNRGRFGWSVEVREGHHHIMNIDWADAFPRYFFSLQRAFDEINDYIQFNQKDLGIIPEIFSQKSAE